MKTIAIDALSPEQQQALENVAREIAADVANTLDAAFNNAYEAHAAEVKELVMRFGQKNVELAFDNEDLGEDVIPLFNAKITLWGLLYPAFPPKKAGKANGVN